MNPAIEKSGKLIERTFYKVDLTRPSGHGKWHPDNRRSTRLQRHIQFTFCHLSHMLSASYFHGLLFILCELGMCLMPPTSFLLPRPHWRMEQVSCAWRETKVLRVPGSRDNIYRSLGHVERYAPEIGTMTFCIYPLSYFSFIYCHIFLFKTFNIIVKGVE